MAKLVSILIPAYNAGSVISETIQSALDQTWKNIEIIIVDDGSTDNTPDILRNFKSSKIKCIHQNNKGASYARNIALSNAQGDYIQWLDADDILAADKISKQMKYAEKSQSDVIFSSAFGKFYWNIKNSKFVKTSLWKDFFPKDWLITKFNTFSWMTNNSWLVSRSLTDIAGPWDTSISYDDDGEYFCRLVSKSSFVKFIPDSISYYRQWNFNSLSKTLNDRAMKSLITSLDLCVNYLLELDNSPSSKNAAINYLQSLVSLHHDYPALFDKLNMKAIGLGGSLTKPEISSIEQYLQALFGKKIAKKIKNTKKNLFFNSISISDYLSNKISLKR